MQLTDLNPARDIGANCLLIELGPFRFILDCGMHPKRTGLAALPALNKLADDSIDFFVITHSHFDHIGGLPVAARYQRKAPIYCTLPTEVLMPRMLRNSCNVMMRQRDELNLPELPLFTFAEVERLEGRIRPLMFRRSYVIEKKGDRLEITLFPAGHVAGAAGVRIVHGKKRYFFTGDVLFADQLTLEGARFPEEEFDLVVTETTRGARARKAGTTRDSEAERMIAAIDKVLGDGGTALVPVFALGRMQEVMALVREARRAKKLRSSLIFASGLGLDLVDYFDTLAQTNPTIRFKRKILKEMNVQPLRQKLGPGREPGQRGLYIVSSGMMVENTPSYALASGLLAQPRNGVFFVGYCDPDTPGGKLLAAKPGEQFSFNALQHVTPVHAKVERFDLSGHAEREELLAYAAARKPKTVMVTHGDPDARKWFAESLGRLKDAPRVIDPVPGDVINV